MHVIRDRKRFINFWRKTFLYLRNNQLDRTICCSFFRKYGFFRKDCLTRKYFASNFICDKRGSINFCRKIKIPLQKNAYVNTLKFFFSIFSRRMLLSSKKLWYEKIFETSFPIKKVIFIFVVRRPLRFKRDLAPKNGFSLFSWKIQLSLKKTVK